MPRQLRTEVVVYIEPTWQSIAKQKLGAPHTNVPWDLLSKMARTFTKKAQQYERALSMREAGVTTDNVMAERKAERACTEYAIKFAKVLKEYGLKIGSD